MIAHWMLYCAAVGALLGAGAAAAEGALRSFGRPTRWAWAAAIVLTLAIPAAARWLPRAPQPLPVRTPVMTVDADAPATLPVLSSAAAETPRRIDVAALDRPLALVWMGSTAAAVLALLAAWAVLERRRRRWRAGEVDGVPVLLSPRTGPAVVGLFRSRIVLPEWVVRDAEPEVRALLLEHEREHLRAGDPRLLALGLAAAALMPWNPAAWWQLRRLRLAVEVDCDARVLARRGDVRAYGGLLLEVGRRASSVDRMITVAAFSEPASFLERRIRMMTSPRARRPLLRAAGFGGVAALLVAAACRAPGPARAPSADAQAPAPPQYTPREAVQRLYPQIAQGTGDTATVVLAYSPTGELLEHRMTVRGQRPGGPIPAALIAGGRLERHQFPAGDLGPDPVTVFTLRQVTAAEQAAGMTVLVDTVVTTAGAEPVQGEAVTVAGIASTQPVDVVVAGTATTRPGDATIVTTTTSTRPGGAAIISGTASTRPGGTAIISGTASTRPGEATVITTTTSTRPGGATVVTGTAATRPGRAVVVPGSATTRPVDAVTVPASQAPRRDTVPVSVVNPEEIARALRREYPAPLRAAGIEGSAVLELRVAANGTVAGTRVVESSHPAFGPAAVRAIAAARFRPARHQGTAVATTVIVPLQFHVDRGSTPPLTSARAGRNGAMSTAAGAGSRTWDQPPVPVNVDEITRGLRAEYPPMLRAAGIAADAQVRVRVGADGQVLGTEAVEASHPEAAAAAARVLSGARFRPARKDGRAVEAEVVLPVQFRLDGGERP